MNHSAMIKPHPARFALPAVVPFLLMLAACGQAPAPPLNGTNLHGATIGGSFTLTGRDGKPVRWEDFNGKYRIVYFGYAFCPDACPTDVGVMMTGYNAFKKADPEAAAKVQPIFISIDPARDTPAKVGEFADAFGPPLIGLTGTPEQIAATAKAFKAYYARGEDRPTGYLMDHSRSAYLMGPDGKAIEGLPVEQGAEAVAADLAAIVK